MSVLKSFAVAVVTAIVICSPALAEDDPPARAARLNYISGQVSLQPGGVNDWVAAGINRPLTSSDRIWVDTDSCAEVQMGSASMRMDENTSITLVNVLDNNVQIQLDEGTLNLHVTQLFDGEIYAIDTPNVQFVVRKRGTYRFDVDNAGDKTDVTVFDGEGDVTGNGPAIRVKKDSRYTFSNGRSLQYAANHNPGRDGFDDWCLARADREDRSESARYVSRYMVGYSDLDDNGYWEVAPTYGRIWVPRHVVGGWSPYRYGHWVWVAPWGWTWVDDAPWGFAPFHYGRWVRYRNYWGWCPGPIHVRPYYAPALVAWVGGNHWGVGLSFGVGGGVGWFPLGWGDPYVPYYRHSRGYFRNVNVTNTRITNITYVTNNYYNNRTNIRNIHYRNRDVNGAVTAVSNDDFRSSRPTRGHFVNVSAGDMKHAEIERDVRIRPTTNSILGANAGQKRTEPPMWRTSRNNRMDQDGQRGPSKVAGNDRPGTDRPSPGVRPGRDVKEATPSANASNVNRERPMRNVPRPPERGGVATTAEVTRPNDAPRPDRRISDKNETGKPSEARPRVPRPPDSLRHDLYGRGNDQPDRITNGPREARESNARPDGNRGNVSRPPAGQVVRPEPRNEAVGNRERPSTPRSVEPRSVPRPPEGQIVRPEPRRDDGNRDARPNSSQREERSASRPEPQRTYTPPARESNGPSRSEQRVYSPPPRVEHSSSRYEPRGDSGSAMRGSPAPQRSAAPPSHSAGPSQPSHQGGRSESHGSRGNSKIRD